MNPEDRARELFARTFGTSPMAVATAPGRINLIGEHIDYHGGLVLPMAIAERTAVALGPGSGLAAVSEQAERVSRDWPAGPTREWTDYVAGVAMVWGLENAPWREGLRVAVASDVPSGAGVSSSAALEVATARALAAWSGRVLSGAAAADLAWRTETGFVGTPCGRMDQIASALGETGSAMLLDCRTLRTESVAVPEGLSVELVPSGEAHALRDSGYAERRCEGDEAMALLRQQVPTLECLTDLPPARLPSLLPLLPAPLDRRVRHVVNEHQRVGLAAKALESGDLEGFGTLVNASHDSLRDLYECSTPRLDAIVAEARAQGALGARLVGAGWGGSVLVVKRSSA